MATNPNPDSGRPRRVPKLTYRNRISENESHITSDSNAKTSAGTTVLDDEKPMSDQVSSTEKSSLGSSIEGVIESEDDKSTTGTASRKHSESLRKPDSIRHFDSRPSTARTNSSNLSKAENEDRHSKRKKNSMLDFLTLREPSTRALEEFAEQERRKAAAKKNTSSTILPGVSSQKLPSTVPKVNSKWDGMPRESEAAKARRLASRRESSSTNGRSLKFHSQTSLSQSFSTSSSENSHAPPNSRVTSLRGSNDKLSIASTTDTGSARSAAFASPALPYPDLITPTPGALNVHSSSTLKTPSLPSLRDPTSYFPPNMLQTVDDNPGGTGSTKTKGQANIAIRKDSEGHERSPSNEHIPKLVDAHAWPSKPLHSPSGSQDAHIHPALRTSGIIYESESPNSSSDTLSKHGSGTSTPRDTPPRTPTGLGSLEEEFFDSKSLPKSRDSEKTEIGENWPLPGPGAEPIIFQPAEDQAMIPSFKAEVRRKSVNSTLRDSGYDEIHETTITSPTEKSLGEKGAAFNFSRRDSVRRVRKPTSESVQDAVQEQVSDPAWPKESEPSSWEFSSGDHYKSIHLGVGFETDDIASIAGSQAPSEMSDRWYKAPKERLGLGSRVFKKDAMRWDAQDDEQDDKKRRFPMPLFGRG